MPVVKNEDGDPCKHLMKWEPSEGQNKGTGTSGLCKHLKHKHPHQYDEAMKDEGTTAEKKAPVAAAIGKEM